MEIVAKQSLTLFPPLVCTKSEVLLPGFKPETVNRAHSAPLNLWTIRLDSSTTSYAFGRDMLAESKASPKALSGLIPASSKNRTPLRGGSCCTSFGDGFRP